VDGVPGFVPRVLLDPNVSLFRAEDRVFEAMLDGWRSQMLARGLAVDTIKARTGVVGRFQVFTGDYPWTWRPVDIEDFLAELRSRSRPIGLTTLRSYSNAVSMFCAYLTHPGYGWGELCERTFGNVPTQICFDWNTPRHTTDDAVPPARRSFTQAELQHLRLHRRLR
jgi:integrase/recombinase XerD